MLLLLSLLLFTFFLEGETLPPPSSDPHTILTLCLNPSHPINPYLDPIPFSKSDIRDTVPFEVAQFRQLSLFPKVAHTRTVTKACFLASQSTLIG